MKRPTISMRKRDSLIGLFYITPFLIGICVFFLFPIISSLLLSFGDLDRERVGFHIVLRGIQNYKDAFVTDTEFVPKLLTVIKDTLIRSPLVVLFSLILAVMLSKVRRCKGFFRVVFLMPFILGTGEVMTQLLAQGVDTGIISLANNRFIPREWLVYIGAEFVEVLDMLFTSIIRILWQSSVQIILFLSAILGISPSLYESAQIDGANAYEMFWKITLPMVSPVLLLNMIYTIISSFTESTNGILLYISDKTLKYAEHGYASALGWIYFAFVLLLIGAVALLIGGYMKRNQGYGGK